MSNVSIYDKNWIDLVFENKNKSYGAYQLRQENSKTTLLALVYGLLFFFSLSSIGWLFSSFSSTPEEVIIHCQFGPTIKPEAISPRPKEPQAPTQRPKQPKTPNLNHIIVVQTPDADPEVPKNNALPVTSDDDEHGDGKGIPSTGGETPGTNLIPEMPKSNFPVSSGLLDKLPEYPGGIKRFYDFVGKNIERPEMDESNAISMNVIMSFVIETDGTMTDIKVLRSNDAKLEKEAIRVLQSLKTKWSPGVKDGEYVRTLYMLPIKVAF